MTRAEKILEFLGFGQRRRSPSYYKGKEGYYDTGPMPWIADKHGITGYEYAGTGPYSNQDMDMLYKRGATSVKSRSSSRKTKSNKRRRV